MIIFVFVLFCRSRWKLFLFCRSWWKSFCFARAGEIFFVLQEPAKVFFAGTSESGGGVPTWYRDVRRKSWARVSPRKCPGIKRWLIFKKILSVSGECTEGVLWRKWWKWTADAEVLSGKIIWRWKLFLGFHPRFSLFKGCSDGWPMGSARSSYSLCHHLLDHGDLQVHLWLVDLKDCVHKMISIALSRPS